MEEIDRAVQVAGHRDLTSPWTAPCGAATRPPPVEVGGFIRLVSNIRAIEQALGDGVKRVYPREVPQMEKLRRVRAASRTMASTA